MPSDAAVAATCAIRLGLLAGDTALIDRAHSLLKQYKTDLEYYPNAYGQMAILFDFISADPSEVYVVGEAENGEEAVEMTADLKPDLVLMDVQMPGIDGLEATRRIMDLDHPPHVLVMSTHEGGDYDAPAVDAGAFGFIPKSQFSMDALEDTWAAIRAAG